MDRRVSIYLDIVRVLAAGAVLFQHISMSTNGAFVFFQHYGHAAVIAFFVLSGYVIAFVANEKEHTLQDYLSHRFARIYSVMLVAWILTVLLDLMGSLINPDIYAGNIASDWAIIRLLAHITFLHESWLFSIHWFSNQPLWSLSYEFMYYLLFGAAFYLQGRTRYIVFGLLALVVGPVLLIYGLIWWGGAVLYYLHKKDFGHNRLIASTIFILSAVAMLNLPNWKEYLVIDWEPHHKLSMTTVFRDFVFAALMLMNIYFFKYSHFSFSSIKPAARFLSGISFSLYVFHYPLILFFSAVILRYFDPGSESMFIMLVLLTVFSVYLLSFVSEKKKDVYFRFFDSLFSYLRFRFSTVLKRA